MKNVAAVILAAGKGTRMKSTTVNKVALKIGQKPLIDHAVTNLEKLILGQIVVVIGFAHQSVRSVLHSRVTYAVQKKPLGTANALKSALPHLSSNIKTVISLYGDDSAFYPPKLYRELILSHQQKHALVSVVSIKITNPTGLGRIIRDQDNRIKAIVEEKNASPQEKQIQEINTGLYCFDIDYLKSALPRIKKNPVSQEYYLTDIIALSIADGHPVNTLLWPDPTVWHGVNNPREYAAARARL